MGHTEDDVVHKISHEMKNAESVENFGIGLI